MPMRILTTMRKQPAWLWDNPIADGRGHYTYDSPVHILVRWEESREKFLNAAGEEVLSRALVYVGQDVKEGAMLMLDANFEDSSGTVPRDPTAVGAEAWPVRGFSKIPTLKADGFLRTAYL